MRKRIALILPSLPDLNPGMISVEDAWETFASRHKLQPEVVKYRFECISESTDDTRDFRCLSSSSDELSESDAIIYWGDFLQMNVYHQTLADLLVKAKCAPSHEHAGRLVRRALLLEGFTAAVKSKVIGFGGTLCLDSLGELLGSRYDDAIKSLLKSSNTWLPRDWYTADIVRRLRDPLRSYQGVDCAMLGWDELVDRSQGRTIMEAPGRGDIGVFFGRSHHNPYSLLALSRRIASERGASTVWIPWLEKPKSLKKLYHSGPRFRWASAQLGPRILDEALERQEFQLGQLRSFSLIVTDTYHLAVNAWAAGVPAVCLGETTGQGSWDVNSGYRYSWRDKRFLHYLMYDALDFFGHLQALDSPRKIREFSEHVNECREKLTLCDEIHGRMASSAVSADARLADAISLVVS